MKATCFMKMSSEQRRKGGCILASVLIHFVFLFFLVRLDISVPVNAPSLEVYNVILAPPPKLTYSYEYLVSSAMGSLSADELLEASREAGRIIAGAGGEAVSKRQGPEISRESAAELSPPFEPAGKFNMDFSAKESPSFSLVPGRQEDLVKKNSAKYNRAPLRLPDSGMMGFSSLSPGGGGIPASRLKPVVIVRGRKTVVGLEEFDISPWADEVVKKIQENWIVSAFSENEIKGQVRIYVVIDKSGSLLSTYTADSSGFSSLDKSVLAAVMASAPFPPLPDGLAVDSLEVYLEFQYDG